MTPADRKKRFDRLSSIGCIVCRNVHGVITPAIIHHLKGLKYSSLGKKANDAHTIPLCVEHHTGFQGIHHIGMKKWESLFGTQEEHLQAVDEMIARLH